MKKPVKPLYFHLTHRVDAQHGNFEIDLVEKSNDGGGYCVAGQDGWFTTNPFRDFVVTAQWNRDRGPEETAYAFHCEYRRMYSMDLARAESCVKFLRDIRRKLKRLDDDLGSPRDFESYVRRVGKVLGVTGYVEHKRFEGWGEVKPLYVMEHQLRTIVRESLPGTEEHERVQGGAS